MLRELLREERRGEEWMRKLQEERAKIDRGKGIDKMEKEGKRVGLSIGGGVGEKGNVGRVRNKIMKG